MIVKQILTLLLVFFACVCTWAQDGIAVKSCVENVTDLSDVSEWCQDLSDEKPVGSTTDMYVCRGGDMTDASHYCTPYFRSSNTKDYRGRGQGLRLVMR